MFLGDHTQWLNLQMPLALSGQSFSFTLFLLFCLVSRCVQKIMHDKASGILVIPLWTSQPYFTVVLSLLIDMPCTVKAGRPPSSSPLAGVTGMQIIRRSLHKSEILPDIVEVIMHSWRDSTQRQYKVYINKWLQFCSEGSHDPLHPTLRAVLSFLHSLFKNGLSYSALNTARSAVSNIDMNDSVSPNHTPVGKHFLVCRYLKGVFNKLKPVPKYNNIWPVDTVLDFLSLFWPLDQISLKELTLKLVMLIALTTGQRCQTLTFLDTSE